MFFRRFEQQQIKENITMGQNDYGTKRLWDDEMPVQPFNLSLFQQIFTQTQTISLKLK